MDFAIQQNGKASRFAGAVATALRAVREGELSSESDASQSVAAKFLLFGFVSVGQSH